MIERRLENLLALDYPADKLELVVTSDASTDRTHELVERFGDRVRLIVNPRGGKVAAQNRAVRETERRDRRLLRRERDLGARRAAPARRELRRPGRRLRLRAARARGGRRLQPRGPLLALRDGAARGGVAARLGHRRQRLDLRGAPLRLRRGRPEVGPRPRVPVPDGAGRPPRRLRARGAGVREADAVERDRVPAQGAHVRALLGDHAARLDAEAAPVRLPGRGDLAPAAPLRQRRPPPRPARDVARARRRGARLPGRARRRSCCCSPPRLLGVGIARYYALVTWATVVSLWNYLRRGVPATWEAAEGTR